MFETIEYLLNGNQKQIHAYNAIKTLGIVENLAEFDPILCGTLPIGIDIVGSDLDIIMEVVDFHRFEEKVVALYGGKEHFKLKRLSIRQVTVVKANFMFDGFEFELFGQSQPVKKQFAYLHMIIENSLMKQFPHLRAEVIELKKQGYKTEPAFCNVLGLKGDPYEALLNFGKQMRII